MAPVRRQTVNLNPPVNHLTNRNNLDINSGINPQMLNQLIAARVVEALVAATTTNTASTQEETNPRPNTYQDKTCSYKEFGAVMQESFRGTEGVVGLTRWFEKLNRSSEVTTLRNVDNIHTVAAFARLPVHNCGRQDIRFKELPSSHLSRKPKDPRSQGGQGSEVYLLRSGR
ncbi:hypothetical protein Tco_0921334 [Tanacetum coccineum]